MAAGVRGRLYAGLCDADGEKSGRAQHL